MNSKVETRAFNMVESMVVLTMVIALLALLLPIVEKARNVSKYAVCTNNLHQLYLAKQSLSVKNGRVDHYPDPELWQTEIESVIKKAGEMFCPMGDDFSSNFKTDPNFSFLPTPPADMSPGKLESNSKVFVFREKENFVLPRDVAAITESGSYGKGGQVNSFAETGYLPEGAVVDVFMFHYDGLGSRINESAEGKMTEIRLGATIAGFIASPQGLKGSDEVFAVPGIKYDQSKYRGLEPGSKVTNDGIVLPDDKDYINYLTSRTQSHTDGMRVISLVGGGTNYGMNKSVANTRRDQVVFLADSKLPVIDFDGKDDDDHTFNQAISPRHEGKVNVVWKDGAVELVAPESLQPDSVFWGN